MEHPFGGVNTPLHQYRHFSQESKRLCYLRGGPDGPLSSSVLQELEDRTIKNTQAARHIEQKRAQIIQEIYSSKDLVDKDKTAFFQELEGLPQVNENTLEAFHSKFKKQLEINRLNKETFLKVVLAHPDAFGKDQRRNVNVQKEYIDGVQNIDSAELAIWASSIQQDVTDRIAQIQKGKALAKKLTPHRPEKQLDLHKLRRHEVNAYIARMETIVARLESTLQRKEKLFSEAELKEIRDDIADSSESEQESIVQRINTDLSERAELQATFEKLPSKHQPNNWKNLSLAERKNALKNKATEVMLQYQKDQHSHRLAKHISLSSKQQAFEYVDGMVLAKLPDKIKALESLDKQFELEEKLSITYEALLNEAEDNIADAEKDSLRLTFYASDYEQKEKKLIPQLKERLEKIKSEEKEKAGLIKEYAGLIKSAEKDGYITSKRATACITWSEVKSRPIEELRKAVNGGFENWLTHGKYGDRIGTVKKFEALPEKTRKPHQEAFYEANFQERLAIIHQLEEEIEEAEKEAAKSETEPKSAAQKESSELLSTEAKIDMLTGQATRAERWKNLKLAATLYEQILELEPQDAYAAERLKAIQEKLTPKSQEITTTIKPVEEDSEEQVINLREKENAAEEAAQKAVEGAMWDTETRRKVRTFSATKTLVLESHGADKDHGTEIAAKRTNDLNAEDKATALQLADATDNKFGLNSDGEVQAVNQVVIDTKNLTEAQKSDRRWRAIMVEISGDKTTSDKSIEIVNEKGRVLTGQQALQKVQRDEDQLKKEITASAQKELKKSSATDEEKTLAKKALQKEVAEQDLHVELAA